MNALVYKNRVVTVEQIQELDRRAISDKGIPSLVLMENAGRAVAEQAWTMLRRVQSPGICVVCGLGNNGGDGLVAARHLFNAGLAVKIVVLGRVAQLKEDARVNAEILSHCGYRMQERPSLRSLVQTIRRADLVIDAIFGVGLSREVIGHFREAIALINQHARAVLAVDIPSGLDGNTGRILGVAVQAKRTVTFTYAKKGMACGLGPKVSGKIVVADIGIPERLRRRL